ncbi:MAG: hypothetical protein AB3N11_03725 [Arenibacterium sp.]
MVMISRLCKTWLGWALIALLVVTGHSMAIARGHSDAISGTLVICSGTEVVMVHLDENGEPTEVPRFCPDGVLALFIVGTGGEGVSAIAAGELQKQSRMLRPAILSVAVTWPGARGPPVSV